MKQSTESFLKYFFNDYVKFILLVIVLISICILGIQEVKYYEYLNYEATTFCEDKNFSFEESANYESFSCYDNNKSRKEFNFLKEEIDYYKNN